MLNKFDLYCEILTEGRKSDSKKKFKVNVGKAKSHIDEIGNKHHHYVHDKGHFASLLDDIDPNRVYTPKSFMETIKSCMKGKGKAYIADGYAKLFYTFLNDRVDSPFDAHIEIEKIEKEPESSEESEDFEYQPDESEDLTDEQI